MKCIVAVGAVYLDTVLTVPHYPQEDAKLRASSLFQRRGGNCANTLEVLQQILAVEAGPNLTTNLCAVLPAATSPDVQFIRSSFTPPVNFKAIYRDGHERAMSSYIIKSDTEATRTIVSYSDLPEMTVKEFMDIADDVGGDAWFHFEGRIPKTTLACIKYVRSKWRDNKISIEVEKPGRLGLEALAAQADVVFYSGSWAQSKLFTTDTASEFLSAQRAHAWSSPFEGALGASMLTQDGTFLHVNAFKQPGGKVVDTVGAGDVFNAGILWTLLHRSEWNDSSRLAFANGLAGLKVVRQGLSTVREVITHEMLDHGFSCT